MPIIDLSMILAQLNISKEHLKSKWPSIIDTSGHLWYILIVKKFFTLYNFLVQQRSTRYKRRIPTIHNAYRQDHNFLQDKVCALCQVWDMLWSTRCFLEYKLSQNLMLISLDYFMIYIYSKTLKFLKYEMLWKEIKWVWSDLWWKNLFYCNIK